MLQIDIIASGTMKDQSQLALIDTYLKRMQWKVNLVEINAKTPADEEKKALEKVKPQAFIIVMDERGKDLPSIDFARKLGDQMNSGISHIQFVIGGADGHSNDVRSKADLILSFGKQTWPHMLLRVMLTEQIYRAQQILAGHPYHRE